MEHGRKIGSRRLIRTFIAIRLPELVLEALGQLSAGVAQDWPPQSVRWARKEGLHLTLRFLGDTEEKQITALQLGLDEAVAGFAPFELCLDGMGCFPNPRRPRVIWVGVADEQERLAALQKAMEGLVRLHGWEREKGKAFKPHLTLGRVRQGQWPPRTWLRPPPALAFQVDEVELIESRLKPAGAEYLTLHRASLHGA